MARWGRPLTDTQIVEIRLASAQNTSHVELARRYSRSVRYINQVVSGAVRRDLPLVDGRTIGVVATRRRFTELKPRIYELADQGWSQEKIALEIGCAQASISRVLSARQS